MCECKGNNRTLCRVMLHCGFRLVTSVTGAREQMGLLTLKESRKKARIKLLCQILGYSDSMDASLVPSSYDDRRHNSSTISSIKGVLMVGSSL